MVKSLRKRPRPDELVSEQRKMTNSRGRIAYLVLLCALGVAVLNFLFGDYLLLRADGLVLRDKHSVEASFLARIERVDIKEGQHVASGDPLFQVQSFQILERLADLSAARARLTAKAAEFRVRAETVKKLLPLATRREAETARVLERFDALSARQLITSVRRDEALASRLEAHQVLVRMNTENATLAEELKALDSARKDSNAALDDLNALYANGRIASPVDGDLGAKIPSPGEVYRPGETILSIYKGSSYVLAYLPRRYLFPIRPGMKVRVTSGRDSAIGTVGKILPVTDALPQEFQNTFKPRDRSQLARVQFEKAPPFPLHQKVQLTTTFFWE